MVVIIPSLDQCRLMPDEDDLQHVVDHDYHEKKR